VWIQEKRDPKKNWLQMSYFITGEEFQWAMKYYIDEWKVPMVSNKGQKGNQPVKFGTSQKSSSPAANTRKVTEHTKDIRGSVIVRKPIEHNNIPNPSTQEKYHTKVTNGGIHKDKDIPMQEELR
jgi:hypothetical protein